MNIALPCVSILRHAAIYALALLLTIVHNQSAAAQVWSSTDVPQAWKSSSKNATSWYRCGVSIPNDWRGRPMQLFVESVDDAREVYFNGRQIGQLGTFPPEYRSGLGRSERFRVPESLIDFGKVNLIAIRVHRNQSRSGFNVAAPVLFGSSEAIRLAGSWETLEGDASSGTSVSARSQLPATSIFANAEPIELVEASLRRIDDDRGPQSPSATLQQLETTDDLAIQVALSEPDIGQPLSFKWDARGRLWVCEYRQYPDPAGLRMISRDKFLRTVYDRIPPPPPHHIRGRDRISIHEDVDGDGHYEKHKVFLDGLNLATSFAFDKDGVWVLNPPYLLFYEDRNHDDVPDGDPEVHLEGFGLEDSHSLVNSLRWGPDGWLYGAQGSTVSGRVKRYGSDDKPNVSMGQLIWRYHPEQRSYEVFAEGGGNAFGLEIDASGRIFSGHNGDNTRGFHYVQGGYLRKGFGKHGQLSNPYAFGYLPAMKHPKVPRFTHAFVVYDGDALPPTYRGKVFAVAPLQGEVIQSKIELDGSTFRTVDEGRILKSRDRWCRPVDIQIGPDGALYVADFYEQRIDHASHYQGRVHRESGRIYRIHAAQSETAVSPAVQSSREAIVALLRHPNVWSRQTALRVIGEQKDQALVPVLERILRTETGQVSLEALWSLHRLDALSDELAIASLQHDNPHVRLWTVRLVSDDGEISPSMAEATMRLAASEENVEVRAQLACSARRLPVAFCHAIVRELVRHDSDVGDPRIPLLLWWAIEAHADDDATLALFRDTNFTARKIVREHLLQRIMRRYAQSGSRSDLMRCASLLRSASSSEISGQYLKGFETAFQGRSVQGIPADLSQAIIASGGGSFELRLRQGDSQSLKDALQGIQNDELDARQKTEWIQILAELKHRPVVSTLLDLATARQTPDEVRAASLGGLQAFDAEEIGDSLVASLEELPKQSQEAAFTTLASRPGWSRKLVNAIEEGTVPSDDVSEAVVANLFLHRDAELQQKLRKIWPSVPGATTDLMRAEISRLNDVIRTGSGLPRNGKPLFIDRCGKCHRLFEDGGSIGPNLTQHDRRDLRQMLANVVNPSLTLREGFESHVVVTEDGRTLSGLMMDQDNQVVVIKDHQGNTKLIRRSEIEDITRVPRSLMPEDTLKDLSDQQVRDLFAYLRSAQPLP